MKPNHPRYQKRYARNNAVLKSASEGMTPPQIAVKCRLSLKRVLAILNAAQLREQFAREREKALAADRQA